MMDKNMLVMFLYSIAGILFISWAIYWGYFGLIPVGLFFLTFALLTGIRFKK